MCVSSCVCFALVLPFPCFGVVVARDVVVTFVIVVSAIMRHQ